MSTTCENRARGQSLAFFVSDSLGGGHLLGLLLIAFLLLTAACGPLPGTTPSPTSAPTLLPPTIPPRPTLPPTWTLTPTYTPAPPTATPTLTLTPSLTATLSAAEACDTFVLISAPQPGIHLSEQTSSGITISWQYPLAGVTASLRITHTPGDEFHDISLDGNMLVAATLPLKSLFGPGLYRWEVIPHDAAGQAIPDCAVGDSFVIIVDYLEHPQGRFVPEPAWLD